MSGKNPSRNHNANNNTLGTTCVSPIYYEVAPTNGEACKKGWMNIGAGYCKKKEPLGIL